MRLRQLGHNFASNASLTIAFCICWTSDRTAFSDSPSLRPIAPSPASYYANATDISADGAAIVGVTDGLSGLSGYLRTGASMSPLASLPNGATAFPQSVADGAAVVVGSAYVYPPTGGIRAFRWTAGGGAQVIPVSGGGLSLGNSYAEDVTPDGVVTVGWAQFFDPAGGALTVTRGFIQSTQIPGGGTLLALPASTSNCWANAVSANGLTVIGTASNTSGQYRAIRWANGYTPTIIEPLEPGASTYASDVSGNGVVVVGWFSSSDPSSQQAFRWTPSSGLQPLGFLPGATYSYATATSADGTVIVGASGTRTWTHAFRWTSSGGLEDLSEPLGGVDCEAWGLNADGSKVVGNAHFGSEHRAIAWSSNGTWEDLGYLPDAVTSVCNGLSGDGTTVIGTSGDADGSHAFVDRAGNGTQILPQIGGTYAYAEAVNKDGSVVFGAIGAVGTSAPVRWLVNENARFVIQPISIAPLAGPVNLKSASAAGDVAVGWFYPAQGAVTAMRWSFGDGGEILGGLGGEWSYAYGVSADGSVVVGESEQDVGFGVGFGCKWVGDNGVAGLLPANACASEARAVSADGKMTAGQVCLPPECLHRACVWDSEGTMHVLESIASYPDARALALSATGRVIGGTALDELGYHTAVLWTDDGGAQNLEISLPAMGIDLSDWELEQVVGVSLDGSTVAGNGTWRGIPRAWVLSGLPVLDSVELGDLNADGVVSAADLGILLGAWGTRTGDLNGDGTTDASDLAILLGAWND